MKEHLKNEFGKTFPEQTFGTKPETAAETLHNVLLSYVRERVKEGGLNLSKVRVEDNCADSQKCLGDLTENPEEQLECLVIDAAASFCLLVDSGTDYVKGIQKVCSAIDEILKPNSSYRMSYVAGLDWNKFISVESWLEGNRDLIGDTDIKSSLVQPKKGKTAGLVRTVAHAKPLMAKALEAIQATPKGVEKANPRAYQFLLALLESHYLTKMAQKKRFPSKLTDEVKRDIGDLFGFKRLGKGGAIAGDPFLRAGFLNRKMRSDWKKTAILEVETQLKAEFARIHPRLGALIEQSCLLETVTRLRKIHYREDNYKTKE